MAICKNCVDLGIEFEYLSNWGSRLRYKAYYCPDHGPAPLSKDPNRLVLLSTDGSWDRPSISVCPLNRVCTLSTSYQWFDWHRYYFLALLEALRRRLVSKDELDLYVDPRQLNALRDRP